MVNPSVTSKLFGVPVFDLFWESVVIENMRPYATTMPNLRSTLSSTPTVIRLPKLFDGGKEKPYARAQQDKQAHRDQMIMIAVGPDYQWPLNAALQAAQGGFMSKAVGTRLADRDKLQTLNPIVYGHGTSSVGGALNFGHLIPTTDPHVFQSPVIRTDSTEKQVYHLSDENRLREWEKLRKDRQPYSKAERSKDLEALATSLDADDRKGEAAEVRKFASEKPTDRQILTWLDGKAEHYKALLVKEGFANVELRQALPGYEAVSVGTLWRQNIQGWNLPEYIAGLTLLAFNYRVPVLGGHASVGCGFHPRRIYRLSYAASGQPPIFDCLFKIEPFKGLAICVDSDVTSGEWDTLMELNWHPLAHPTPAKSKLPDCFVVKAIRAWQTCDRKFDYRFLPRTTEENGDE